MNTFFISPYLMLRTLFFVMLVSISSLSNALEPGYDSFKMDAMCKTPNGRDVGTYHFEFEALNIGNANYIQSYADEVVMSAVKNGKILKDEAECWKANPYMIAPSKGVFVCKCDVLKIVDTKGNPPDPEHSFLSANGGCMLAPNFYKLTPIEQTQCETVAESCGVSDSACQKKVGCYNIGDEGCRSNVHPQTRRR